MLAQLFRRIDRFLCIGTANRRLYESFGVPDTRLYAAPYAVDTPRFERQLETLSQGRLTLRRQWGIPDDAMCVLFCGKFIPKKRPLDLVAAAQLTRHPVHLLFVGSGELGAQLRAQCEVAFDGEAGSGAVTRVLSKPGARPAASFTGFLNQTEISRAYAAADCLVLPSDFDETWGLVVNEAMASGLPCLISDRCGSAQDLGRTSPNRTFPCGDAATLAGTLDEMLAAPRPACGTRALPSFEQTIETVVQLWTEIAALREERIGS